MEKRYWTGKEIIGAGYLNALELGQLAGEGKITAWVEPGFAQYSDNEKYQEIKEWWVHSNSIVPFPFIIAQYAYEMGIEGAIDGPMVGSAYRADIEKMIFDWNEVRKYLETECPVKETEKKNSFPLVDYKNKRPEIICQELKDKGFDDTVIAKILVNEIGLKKNRTFNILYPDEVLGDRAMRARVNKLLAK